MKKAYARPHLAVYGRLEDLTLGVGGSAPDVPSVNNVICATGTVTNSSGATVTITCASVPSR
jgi:hypothetical protein